jgi:hypothetical protein
MAHDLCELSGSADLPIDSIIGTFAEPEPPAAGERCGDVDDFEDLVVSAGRNRPPRWQDAPSREDAHRG